MRLKKLLGLVLTCAVLTGCFSVGAMAADADGNGNDMDSVLELRRATERFGMSIAPNELSTADSSLPLMAGKVVTISAVYTPATASVDLGLIDTDNTFYFIT